MLIKYIVGLLFYSYSHVQIHNTNAVEPKNNYLYVSRLFTIWKNKITKKTSVCVYCKGNGYLMCPYGIDGCWRCSNSGLLPCKFCLGDGKGRLCLCNQSK